MTEVTSSTTTENLVSPPESGRAPPVPAASTRGAPAMLWLLALLALLGAALLGFVFLQQRQAMETLAGDAYTLQQGSAAFERRLAEAEAESQSLTQQLQAVLDESRESAQQLQAVLDDSRDSAQQTDVAALRSELAALRSDVARQAANSTGGWALVEARSLLRLAQQQAGAGRNVDAAISLYMTAATSLRMINDPALQPALAALQLELDALRAVELPDIQGIYLQLGELQQQLATLVVQSEGEAPLQFVAPDVATAEATNWWEQLKQVVSQYFVVTRRDVPVLAQLTPQQAVLVRQVVALQLESARFAVLQGDEQVYRSALATAAQSVAQQLQGDSKAAVLASLQRLQDARILAVIPPLGAALQALELSAPVAAQDREVVAP